MAKGLTLTLEKDKETKGAIRYKDDAQHSIYLRKEEATKLGNPEQVKVQLSAADGE